MQMRNFVWWRGPQMRMVWSVLVILVLTGSIPPATWTTSFPIQPALQAIITQHPSSVVSVIIQQQAHVDLEQAVTRLGGKIRDQLSIIHAVTADLPASGVWALAQQPGVRWLALDSPVTSTQCSSCIDTSRLASAYIRTIGADKVWNRAPYLQGQGIGVAIVDSGIQTQQDLYTNSGQNRLVAAVRFNSDYNQSTYDNYGHGNHVAGIIGGNGSRSGGAYTGVAPLVNLINVKVSNDNGQASVGNVILGLQWIFNNASAYNIRVVNISLNDSVIESYHTSALNAAVEALWVNGIVVVVSAGNRGANKLTAPANDPFVITVGATDDNGTANLADDRLANFSAFGTTTDGFAKPDLVAPGRNIISLMANSNSALATDHPANVISFNGAQYFKMSGTSMSAPMVAAAAALVIQGNPSLKPDQVKYRLKATARAFDTTVHAGAGYLNVDAATSTITTQRANQNIEISRLLAGSSQPLIWNSLTETSGGWQARGSSYWVTASRSGDMQNSATWSSDYWDNTVGAASIVDEAATISAVTIADGPQTPTADEAEVNVARNQQIFLPSIQSNQ